MVASTSQRDVAALFHVCVLVEGEKGIKKGLQDVRVVVNNKNEGRDPSSALLNGRSAGIDAAGSKPAAAVVAAAAGAVGAVAAAEQGAFHAS